MRKILVSGLLILVIVLVIFRQRLFLRDPIATVERNGQRQSNYRVYINYFNDVLLEDLDGNRRVLVQSQKGVPMVPGTPMHLQCMRMMACLTDLDYAATVPLGGREYVPGVEMTNAFVAFQDGDGAAMRVSLR